MLNALREKPGRITFPGEATYKVVYDRNRLPGGIITLGCAEKFLADEKDECRPLRVSCPYCLLSFLRLR